MLRSLLATATLFAVSACATAPTETSIVLSDANGKTLAGEAFLSEYGFAETDRRLKAALDRRDLKTFAVVDHGAGARSVGMSIGQSKLYIFGNPKSGTPLMQANRLMGLELPLKMLVYEDTEGGIRVAHHNIEETLEAYRVAGKGDVALKIARTMGDIVGEATGPVPGEATR